MAFDDEKEELLDEKGLPETDEDDLKDEDGVVDMFGGEDAETTRERDWM
ncbi:MAG TPA: hypothetical protein VJL57_03825 [Candidatus Paceibacterota bacterium]